MKKILFVPIALCFMAGFHAAKAEVRLAGIFADNMVLQREQPVKIWGRADRNELVTVLFNGRKHRTRADRDGAWSVVLEPMPAGGPYVLEAKGKGNAVRCGNVLVGEVWLCSGQSNMEWPVSYSMNAIEEIVAADYPEIRALNVKRNGSFTPLDDLSAEWTVCTPETAGDFSAVAYFYARELHRELGVPVGIINSSWGGTDIETWTSAASYEHLPERVRIPYAPELVARLHRNDGAGPDELDLYSERRSDDAGMAGKWYREETDDSTWERMQVPQEWGDTPLAGTDGLVWFRFAFDLPASAAAAPAELHLGRIDDVDITWVNGVEVGRTNSPSLNRVYHVPANLLKAGRNVVAVRVEDVIGPGGFTGHSGELFLAAGGASPVKVPLAGLWRYNPSVVNEHYRHVDLGPNSVYSLLYNGMIHPLKDFRIRGAIWYQGENNAGRAYGYRTLFPNLIRDWRGQWGYEFPFYWVQLASFMERDDVPSDSPWAELREAQTLTLSLPQTGQAVITDIGDAQDIHPKNKQEVGRRLALVALNKTYGRSGTLCSGPTFRSMEKRGDRLVLTFGLCGAQWKVADKYGYIRGFAVAGADRRFFWAKAELEGDRIVVWSDRVKDPVAVRYAWGNNPDANLFNDAGLPAVPFRTDGWKGVTE